MTAGRAAAMLPLGLGLVALISGWLALRSSTARAGLAKVKAIVALLAALTGIILSGVHLARVKSGIGTGSGVLGASIALALALLGVALGGRALLRSRRKHSSAK